MDFFRNVVSGAVGSDEVMALPEDERFEGLAALQLAKDAREGGAQLARRDLVEDDAHLRVTGNVFHAKQGTEIEGIPAALIVEGQKRGAFQSINGVSSHQSIRQSNAASLALVGNLLELIPHQPHQAIRREMLPFIWKRHRESLRKWENREPRQEPSKNSLRTEVRKRQRF